MKNILLLVLCIFSIETSFAQDFYKRFFNRVGYSMADIETTDSSNRKVTTTASDLSVHGGLQMKLSHLWSGQLEVSLRQQTFHSNPDDSSFLIGGEFDLRRKIFQRLDVALLAGMKQENFVYGTGGTDLSIKKLTLPMIGIQAYVDLVRFITSGISMKVGYLKYFSDEKDQVKIDEGSSVRASLVYLLRYRKIDWSLEYVHERAQYGGNYDQKNISNAINFGLAYE